MTDSCLSSFFPPFLPFIHRAQLYRPQALKKEHNMAAKNILRNVLLSTALLGTTTAALASAFECTDRWGHHYTLSQVPTDDNLGMTCTASEDDADVLDAALPAGSTDVAQVFNFGAGSRVVTAGNAAHGRGTMVMISVNSAPRYTGGSYVSTSSGLNAYAAYDQAIESAARMYGHDADLLRAIIHVESRGNPNAVSSKGAIGLMQVMPTTAAGLGLEQPSRALFQPEANIRTGAIYLRRLMNMFSGRTDLVIAAYNAGEGNVRRYNDTIPPFPETQAYVRNVMARYDNLRASR